MRSIIWPQEAFEVAKFLQNKIQQVFFDKQNYSLLMIKEKSKVKEHLQNF
jgi:hypothetical protein